MKVVFWNSKLLTALEIIDDQHNAIFSVANQLHYSICHNQHKFIYMPVLRALLEITEQHFATE